jgi:hypothetical protein
MKKETTNNSVGAIEVGASSILGTFALTDRKKDDGDQFRPARTFSGSSSGRATLRREQRERIESKHREKPSHGEEGETKHIHRKRRLRYACRLFGLNSRKEWAV